MIRASARGLTAYCSPVRSQQVRRTLAEVKAKGIFDESKIQKMEKLLATGKISKQDFLKAASQWMAAHRKYPIMIIWQFVGHDNIAVGHSSV